ncbi:hypothetical protein [Paenibacillus aceris]|uniref:Uncharacterized protein n=1 Tax=Paenibacillus aceris TaxID=869555 RepID=A0ABS4I317_9BACL|nr:hypothetical protein [Paenibacillus aceris]MBP1964569.1 hypothetical protein [Paenibacillus aceris]NHW35722.1 hypothetical protein [Paenibacillus aceris]
MKIEFEAWTAAGNIGSLVVIECFISGRWINRFNNKLGWLSKNETDYVIKIQPRFSRYIKETKIKDWQQQ